MRRAALSLLAVAGLPVGALLLTLFGPGHDWTVGTVTLVVLLCLLMLAGIAAFAVLIERGNAPE